LSKSVIQLGCSGRVSLRGRFDDPTCIPKRILVWPHAWTKLAKDPENSQDFFLVYNVQPLNQSGHQEPLALFLTLISFFWIFLLLVRCSPSGAGPRQRGGNDERQNPAFHPPPPSSSSSAAPEGGSVKDLSVPQVYKALSVGSSRSYKTSARFFGEDPDRARATGTSVTATAATAARANPSEAPHAKSRRRSKLRHAAKVRVASEANSSCSRGVTGGSFARSSA